MKIISAIRRAPLSLLAAILASGLSLPAAGAADPVAQGGPSVPVNAAPAFVGGAEAGRTITLDSLRGKPVLLVIAPSPRDHAFRKQMQELRGIYERLASQGTLAFAAFTSEGGRIPSNIPFILVNDPAGTAAAYGVIHGFAIAVIGRDGNLDCLSTKPLPGYRVHDLIINNAGMQSLLRR